MAAGEASGDLHGARLLAELSRRMPEVEAFGLGGDEMREAGLELVAHSAEISVVGITEVLKVLPRARQVFGELLAEVDRRRPEAAVLIDFPDFNLRLAEELSARGIKVLYYVSPQVWAWRKGRIKGIAKVVDHMLVLFPFEVGFYEEAGVSVTHVGHPLVDEVPELPQAWDHGPPTDEPYQVALLPGSRPSEVERLLPVMLETVRRLDDLDLVLLDLKLPGLEASVTYRLDLLPPGDSAPAAQHEPHRVDGDRRQLDNDGGGEKDYFAGTKRFEGPAERILEYPRIRDLYLGKLAAPDPEETA